MKDKKKKQTKYLSRFVRRSLLTLSALSLLSATVVSDPSGTMRSEAMSSTGNILTDAGPTVT